MSLLRENYGVKLMIKVIKRNGTAVPFNKEKIIIAITKAYQDTYKNNDTPEYANIIAENVYEVASQFEESLSVEDIQDLVEDNLTEYDRLVAKNYIRYRYKHNVMRLCSTEFIQAIGEKLRADNVQNQNANVDEHSFGGRVGEAADEMMKRYALDYCVSEMARKNHEENMIYIHDLSAYAVGMHNCLSVPFDKLLAEGFNTRQTDVRPANSINTAFQLVAVIFQLQSLMQFGGVSATHLDWTMVPYVRKSFYKHYGDGLKYIESLAEEDINREITLSPDFSPADNSIDDGTIYPYSAAYEYAMDMTMRELQQAVEGMYHNLNTLQSRSGN